MTNNQNNAAEAREQFEKWYPKKNPPRYNEGYVHHDPDICWRAWQAAWQQACEQVGEYIKLRKLWDDGKADKPEIDRCLELESSLTATSTTQQAGKDEQGH